MGFAVTVPGVKRRYTYTLETSPLPPWVDAVSEFLTSESEEERYPFLGTVPKWRRWVNGRTLVAPAEYEFIIRNVLYENSMEIPIKLIKRAQEATNKMLDGFAHRRLENWLDLLVALIEAGESTATWDGQFFFDTDHASRNSGTQSNDISTDVAAPTDPTVLEVSNALLATVQQIMALKDDQGSPMNENASQFLVIHGTGLMAKMGQAIGSSIIAVPSGAANNPIFANAGVQFRQATLARLSWDQSKFAVFRTDAPLKALLRQEEQTLYPDSGLEVLGEGSDWAFDHPSWKVGDRASRAVGYGNYQYACMHTFT